MMELTREATCLVPPREASRYLGISNLASAEAGNRWHGDWWSYG